MVETKDIRNIIVLGHSGSGKTQFSEALLYTAGTTSRLGLVDEGQTVSDYSEDEIERKSSIDASFLSAKWKNVELNIIDAPGYTDFIGQVISCIRAVDSAIILVNAESGVEVGTERMWSMAEQENLPVSIVINKMDKENANFTKVLDDVRSKFGKKCILFTSPIGEKTDFSDVVSIFSEQDAAKLPENLKSQFAQLKESLIEAVAESDDALLEKYLETGTLQPDEIAKNIKKAICQKNLVPVFCSASIKGIGIKQILDVISEEIPSPEDRGQIKAKKADGGEEVLINPKTNDPLSAFVFKTINDPYVGQLTIFRLFSGVLTSNTTFYNVNKQTKERIGQIYKINGKEQKSVDSVGAGEIAALTKLKVTMTGDSMADEKNPVLFEFMQFPEPSVSRSIKPKSRADEDKISIALHKLTAEDMTFRSSRDNQTKELIISGVGDLHLEIMVNRLKKRFGVEVELGTPKVPYKETIKKTARVQGKYKRQSGGKGQYGDVWLELSPLPLGQGFEFVDKIVGGVIPRNYIPSVEKGVRQAMGEGVLAGYPLVDTRVTLYDGSYHEVDSSDIAFQIAGAMAFRKAALEAVPILLEPIMTVEITIPDEYTGDIAGNINSRRGRILGMEPSSSGMQLIKASIPLAEMFKYGTELRSMTQGRGSYIMRFAHYEEVPAKLVDAIVQHAKVVKEAEEKK